MASTFATYKERSTIRTNSIMDPIMNREPVISKTTRSGSNDKLEFAVSSMQGYRKSMEDAHVAFLDLDDSAATSFFAIYDGHGGPAVSNFCAIYLHHILCCHPDFDSNLSNALKRAFFRMDEILRSQKARRELTKLGPNNYCKVTAKDRLLNCVCLKKYPGPLDEGTTACIVLIRGNQIIVGNAGDCRCVLSRNGQAIVLTNDHRPSLPDERQRIQNAGHSVSVYRGATRVDNGIAVSRSIGDMRYKNNSRLAPELQALTCSPEIRIEYITEDAEFLVIACDGVWDVVVNQHLVEEIHDGMRSGMNLGKVCETILDKCVEPPAPSYDNMTIILVRFKHEAAGRRSTESAAISGGTGGGGAKGKVPAVNPRFVPARKSF